MRRTLLLLLTLAMLSLVLTGCPQMQALAQTANDLNKTATDVNKTANDLNKTADNVEQTAKKVDGTVERGKTAASKVDGLELEGGNTEPTQQPAASPQPTDTQSTCCVNGAFYDCGDAAAAAQCIGEPMPLMDCLMPCTDNTCENTCLEKYGPDPSACQRDESRDGSCDS